MSIELSRSMVRLNCSEKAVCWFSELSIIWERGREEKEDGGQVNNAQSLPANLLDQPPRVHTLVPVDGPCEDCESECEIELMRLPYLAYRNL